MHAQLPSQPPRYPQNVSPHGCVPPPFSDNQSPDSAAVGHGWSQPLVQHFTLWSEQTPRERLLGKRHWEITARAQDGGRYVWYLLRVEGAEHSLRLSGGGVSKEVGISVRAYLEVW